jgi:hypothetical protein
LLPILAAAIIAGAVLWAAAQIVRELRAARDADAHNRALAIVQLFAPALGAVQNDPRVLLVWQPLARAIRQLYPLESAAVDRASGGAFPFARDMMAAAHARWTAEWLSWEQTHDADYKLKAATLQHQLGAAANSTIARARLDALEREKLALYQRRYEEYTRVAKALQALATTSSATIPGPVTQTSPAADAPQPSDQEP